MCYRARVGVSKGNRTIESGFNLYKKVKQKAVEIKNNLLRTHLVLV